MINKYLKKIVLSIMTSYITQNGLLLNNLLDL